MTSYSTTTYPAAPGCHLYTGTSTSTEPCDACGGTRWDMAHETVEVHADVKVTGPGWFCVEASDDNGRTYATNGLRWRNVEDAKRWAGGLALRWFGCTNIRVRACDRHGEPTGETIHQTL